MNQSFQSIAVIVLSLLLAGGCALAGSFNSVMLGGLPIFTLCVLIAFGAQWLAFVPAWIYRTERYYDLTGSLTYISITLMCLVLNDNVDARGMLIGLVIIIWSVRLGGFLFLRIRREGADGRFDAIKQNFLQFLMTWTLQGLWITMTAAAGFAAMTSNTPVPLDYWALVGALLWAMGFTIEAVSDQQKRQFREDADNTGRFINTGLWAWSRHPNYFGEMLLWLGVAVIALPQLQGIQHLTLVSPLFVFCLIYYVSGVRLLEDRADQRWGDDPDYQRYKSGTPVLVLLPPRR